MTEPKSYERVTCWACNGHGIVPSYDMAGYMSPDECRTCNGAGTVVRYESGAYAEYPGGKLLGREPRK